MALRLLRALPGVPGLLASVALSITIDKLDPSVGGTGPHGLTVRDCAARLAAQPASIAARTTNRDDAFRPSCGRDGDVMRLCSDFRKAEYFCSGGWTLSAIYE
jgi:hypothetical protein